jgi:LysR family glycine cleavage system transcriptional activator
MDQVAMRRSYIPTMAELQAFDALVRLHTTHNAAGALNLTQSAVSRTLGALEDRLGVLLFHRVRQRLILSDAGRALHREARAVLDRAEAAAMTVMAFGGHADVLRLAVLPTFGATWLIPRLAGFQAVAPTVTLDVATRLHAVDFATEGFDAAIQRGEQRAAGAMAEHLIEERLVVVAAPALLPGGRPLPDAALARLPLLQQATRPNLWLDWFREAGLDPRAILRGPRFEQFGMVIEAAKAGLGAALLPEVLAAKMLADGSLRLASSRTRDSGTPYMLVYPPQSVDLPSFRRFRAWLMGLVA